MIDQGATAAESELLRSVTTLPITSVEEVTPSYGQYQRSQDNTNGVSGQQKNSRKQEKTQHMY